MTSLLQHLLILLVVQDESTGRTMIKLLDCQCQTQAEGRFVRVSRLKSSKVIDQEYSMEDLFPERVA